MNNNRNYKPAFIVSFIFNIVLLMMLSAIGINNAGRAAVLFDANESVVAAVHTIGLSDTTVAEIVSSTDVVELDVPSEEDGMGDGEDLVEVTTTTTPAPAVTTAKNTTRATTARKTTTTAAPAATTTKPATTTVATTTTATTTQKPTTTTTKGSGDNDAEMDWSEDDSTDFH